MILTRRKYALPTSEIPTIPEKGLNISAELKQSITGSLPLAKFLDDWKKHCIAAERQQDPTHSLHKMSPHAMQLPPFPIPNLGNFAGRPDIPLVTLINYLKNSQVNWMFSENIDHRNHHDITKRILLVMGAEHIFWLDHIIPLLDKSPDFLSLLEFVVKLIKASSNFQHSQGILWSELSLASQLPCNPIDVEPEDEGEGEDKLEVTLKELFAGLKDTGLVLPKTKGLVHPAVCNLLFDFLQGCRSIQEDISQMGGDLAMEELELNYPPDAMEVPLERLEYFNKIGIKFATLGSLQNVIQGEGFGKLQGQKRKSTFNEEENGMDEE